MINSFWWRFKPKPKERNKLAKLGQVDNEERRRNEKIWEDEEKQPIISIHQTRELFCQWQQVRAGADAQGVHITENDNIWQLPPCRKLKCNIDAAIFADLNRF
ncbi:hypothetical protein L195_g052584 [Trifolium pratense]|uniref:Uncharacterized protein n=1 Tax=Trifolium pratense TaxID=57577 RepID=A0A2K3K5W6_TRIPR|nr:hypothetical protein L195_g052584 [Trifolium pratense]